MPRYLIGNTLLTLLFIASVAAAELQDSYSEKYFPYADAATSSNAAAAPLTIPFFPSTANEFGRQGFARIVNRSDRSGTVEITAFDDTGRRYGPATLSLDPLRTVHFNSGDLEDGNADKIAVGIGQASEGDWRLELSSDLEISVLSYIRTRDGFVTSMHDVAPSEGNRHGIAFFNPGSNTAQVSYLRLVNTGDAAAEVTVRGVDDAGVAAPGGTVRFSIPAHGARTLDAHELEEGAVGLNGTLGDGVGKWRLVVEADRPITAMSMLGTPTGHLTNLSTDPGYVETEIPDDAPPAPTVTALSATEIRAEWSWEYRSGDSDVFDRQIRVAQGGSWQLFCHDYGGGPSGTFDYRWTVSGASPNTSYDVRYRHRPSGSCDSGTPGTWSGIGSARTPSDGGGGEQAPDLVVEAVSVSDSSPDAGESFTLSATVRNGGDGSADATTLRYYRSTNSTISSGDTEAGTDSVRALSGSASSPESISLPAPSSAGTYYYGACVDSVSGESNTANNCSDGVRVQVADSGGGGRAGECVEGDTYEPGEGCDVYGTGGSSSNQRFSVLSNGRARFAFSESGNSIDNRGGTINGVAYHFLASHQGNGVWKVDEYRP